MSRIPVKFEPFTAFNHCAGRLGGKISNLVNEPETKEVIGTDFPHVLELYETVEKAKRTVQRRQDSMLRNTGFGALAIVIGNNQEQDIEGVASYNQIKLKYGRLGKVAVEGPLFAAWKRPRFRNIGDQVLESLMRYMVRTSTLSGHAFTVVRPENARAMEIMAGAYDFGRMKELDDPRVWDVGDGSKQVRQLFVASKSLEELRADLSYSRPL